MVTCIVFEDLCVELRCWIIHFAVHLFLKWILGVINIRCRSFVAVMFNSVFFGRVCALTLVISVQRTVSIFFLLKVTSLFKWTDISCASVNTFWLNNFTALLFRLFGISCSNVSERLVSQIKAWQISRSCLYAGEQCSYEVRHITSYSLTRGINFLH